MTPENKPAEASFRCRIDDVYGLHDGYSLTLRPGYTAIVGPNGAGKTTLLWQLGEIAEGRGYLVYKYSNLTSGGDIARQKWLVSGDIRRLATAATSSEGENITLAFGQAAQEIGRTIKQAVNENKPLMILLDGLDSGASIDRLQELLGLFRLILKDTGVLTHEHPERGIYIITAANAYELAKEGICVDPRTGKNITFGGYTDYAEFICTYFNQNKERGSQEP